LGASIGRVVVGVLFGGALIRRRMVVGAHGK
jgi:hypothetical protein